MISYSQVVKTSSSLNLPEETIEKDYFIELLLFYIATEKKLKDLIFRGGTALRKIYFPDYRFSEDLDFLIINDIKEILDYLGEIVDKINQDFPAEVTIKRNLQKHDRLQIFVGYNIVSQISAIKELKVDILRDTDASLCYKKRKIIFTYEDFKDFRADILVYDLESVIVDKISRIFDVVNEPRDVYDIWNLLKNTRLDFQKIKKMFKQKHGFKFNVESFLSEAQKPEYKVNWEARLSRQVSNIPDFDEVIKELNISISKQNVRKLAEELKHFIL